MSTVLERHSRQILQQAKGDWSSKLDWMVLGTVRREAGPRERRPKVLKTKPT
jgi:hypothetical protein